MQTIVIYNGKGGVGKTTFADELAFSYERDGRVVQIVDADGQGGLIHAPGPRQGAEVTIIDMPGQVTDHDAQFLSIADLVVIPMRWSMRDRAATATTIGNAAKAAKGARILLVVNEVNLRSRLDRTAAGEGALAWIRSLPGRPRISAGVFVPSSVRIREAADQAVSVCELAPDTSAACAINDLCALAKASLAGDIAAALPKLSGRSIDIVFQGN